MPLGGASLRPKIKLMPPVTLFLIAANAGIFLLQLSAPGLETAFALWPLGAARASGGQVSFQVWQLVTYAFLHGGLLHIGFNMFALYMFGSAMEQVFGPRRYLTYYFVCVLSAGIEPWSSRSPAIRSPPPTLRRRGSSMAWCPQPTWKATRRRLRSAWHAIWRAPA